MSWWKRFKQGVDSYRYLTPSQPTGVADGENLVYEVNQVYMDIGQGGTSPIRGFGALPILVFCGWFSVAILGTIPDTIDSARRWDAGALDMAFDVGLSAFGAVFVLLVGVFYFWVTFLAPTDALVRLDRKRQKVWLWNGRNNAVEVDWNRMVPRIHTHVANQFGSSVSHAQYVELDENGGEVKTGKRAHLFQCGHTTLDTVHGFPNMEFVRRYMAAPVDSSPPYVKQFLKHRPKWWAMINIFNWAEDWSLWYRDRDKPGLSPMPWFSTIIHLLWFPLWFPLQFSNWLALRLAPIPKWPKELEAMHAADLAELANQSAQSRESNPGQPRRKPVIRVNGQIVDS